MYERLSPQSELGACDASELGGPGLLTPLSPESPLCRNCCWYKWWWWWWWWWWLPPPPTPPWLSGCCWWSLFIRRLGDPGDKMTVVEATEVTTGPSRLSAEVRQVVDWVLLPPPDEEMDDVRDVDELADGGFSAVVVDERNETERRAELIDDDGEPSIAEVRLLDRIRPIGLGDKSESGSPGSTIFKTGKYCGCCCCCCGPTERNWLAAATVIGNGDCCCWSSCSSCFSCWIEELVSQEAADWPIIESKMSISVGTKSLVDDDPE